MKKFIDNVKKYYSYAVYSAKSELKSEVAGSYLNWLWWILDPLAFMMIYTFIVTIVFRSNEQYFPVFVLIGLTTWNFFNSLITSSVKIVNNNRNIVSKIYLPKYILIISKSFVLLFKMSISFALIILMMVVMQIPFSWTILQFLPILIVLYVITFGISSILLHFGIFVEDLANLMNIVLKLMFYLSGIFYSIGTRLPVPYNSYFLNFNPAALVIDSFRKILINGSNPDYLWLFVWLIIGLLLTMIGINIIHKHENSYAKVI
ncbi:MAG: ABC transporter permease [Bacilli bacterium]|nr:ABC transporter permease [Bacilli bacterium]